MRVFHIRIHARQPAVRPSGRVNLGGVEYAALDVPATAQGAAFSISFEQACAALLDLPRMFIEPDGALLWAGGADETAWQLDGNLYDRQERLLFVELKGSCPPREFDRLLAALSWPETDVMFELVREAVHLDLATFREYAFC